MEPLFAATQGAILTVWGVSLAIGAVVIVVVAVLLALIRRTAQEIETGVAAIWTEGKLTANNTIQIPLFLHTTQRVSREIYANAADIAVAAESIEQHAEGCPGCPACVLPRTNR